MQQEQLTPLRQQYLNVKQRYADVIVFFRLGDFYETFDEDAQLVAKELDIVLTAREMGKGNRIPMAGIPHHAVDNYLARLINKGHKVAICEQLTPPGKGLVERDVVRVVTPGTVIESNLLDDTTNNYLASIIIEGDQSGIAYADITTSEFVAAQLHVSHMGPELARLQPSELLIPHDMQLPHPITLCTSTPVNNQLFDLEQASQTLKAHFGVITLDGFGCARSPLAIRAAGAIIRYIEETQRNALSQLTTLSTYSPGSSMALDSQTRRNLELLLSENQDNSRSLLSTIDHTRTSMGGRLLKKWMGLPLLTITELNERLDAVQQFHDNGLLRNQVAAILNDIADIERLTNRVRGRHITPKELVTLRYSLELVPSLKDLLDDQTAFENINDRLHSPDEIVTLIAQAITDDPPSIIEDGGVIRTGFSPEMDQLRSISRDAKQYLANLERQERERTGIKSLKVGYNRVFGYYIEVSKSNLPQIPPDYIRKQTLTNAERFITSELKDHESLILNAQERTQELESTIFHQVCEQVGAYGDHILTVAHAISQVDVFYSLAETAVNYSYTRPELTDEDSIVIKGGRHPVVERSLDDSVFIPNDTNISNKDTQIIVLTGPNMSGKSTYLRQIALIVLLAQMGSFVPADSARIGIVDRIFTRIGAQDDLAAGRSTFMVEMVETANILNNATPKSLIILDEIGRGTSTYDGLSIAHAVVEYIHNHPRMGAKTVFATHYHELVELADFLPRVKNYNVAVSERGDKVEFLRKIIPGGADKSYGIHVAQLAGLPKSVVHRAQEVLSHLENEHPNNRKGFPQITADIAQSVPVQLTLSQPKPSIVEDCLSIDIDSLSPLEAITKLYELQNKAREASF
ncbi:MAG: DNA mismatch repair protein MutS [Chloroflexota bacterium]|nr:DNA mismatch repair protein MutS [Chloroflexota bacterium]